MRGLKQTLEDAWMTLLLGLHKMTYPSFWLVVPLIAMMLFFFIHEFTGFFVLMLWVAVIQGMLSAERQGN